jgi:hypothetical protein
MRTGFPQRLSSCALTTAQWLLRDQHAEWGRAMHAEFCAARVDGYPSMRWALGCLMAAARLRCARVDHRYVVAALAMIAALLYVEWHSDTDTAVLVLLLGGAAVLGFMRPQRATLTGLVLGESLLVAHASTTATGLYIPFYQFAPLTPVDWVTVASVGIPAFLVANVGAACRRTARVK